MSAEVTRVETTYKLVPGVKVAQRWSDSSAVITIVRVTEYTDGRPNYVGFEGYPLSKHGKPVGGEGVRALTDESAAQVMAIVGGAA